MSDAKLDLILQEMQDIKSQMNSRFDTLETGLSKTNTQVDAMKTKVDHLQSDITHIKDTIERIDDAVNEDIIAILKTMQNRTTDNDADIVVLNDRLFKAESKIQKIIGQ